jgi:hypothetical protein
MNLFINTIILLFILVCDFEIVTQIVVGVIYLILCTI